MADRRFKGTYFVDLSTGKQMVLIDDNESFFGGWLCYWHETAGSWVTMRRATPEDRRLIKNSPSAN